MPDPACTAPHRVVIAGGGIAGLEALMTLRELAPDGLEVTLIAPDDTFTIRALSVREPFASPGSARWPVGAICHEHGATYLKESVTSVDTEGFRVRLGDGTSVPYDSLLVAVGARAQPAWPEIPAFRGAHDAEIVHGLVQDVEEGYTKRVAFVVPLGTTWPLPLYELALLLAQRAREAGHDDTTITFVTAERDPLGVLGEVASAAVRRSLADAGVDLHTACDVATVHNGRVVAAPDRLVVEAERVLTAPRLQGPMTAGLPCDTSGFIPVDPYGRVPRCPGVYAAGDGTTVPVKQGGLAAAEGAAAATTIAAAAGADVTLKPYEPAIRAQLLTGTGTLRLQGTLPWLTTEDDSTATEHGVLWPPSKVVAPRLNAWIADHSPVGAR